MIASQLFHKFPQNPLPEDRLDRFFLELALILFQPSGEGVFHTVGGIGGSCHGIYLLVQSLFNGETVPRLEESTLLDALGETGVSWLGSTTTCWMRPSASKAIIKGVLPL